MTSYQSSFAKIAADYHARIHDHIAQVKNAQVELVERANRERELGLRREMCCSRGVGMEM